MSTAAREIARLRLTCDGAYDDALVPDFSCCLRRARTAAGRLLAVAALLVVAACSGGDDGDGGAGAGSGGDGGGATAGDRPEFAFTVTGTDVQAMAAQPPAFPPEVAAKVKAGLDAYLADGVIEPVRDGKAPAGLEQSFTPAALARLTTSAPDRSAVLEDGVTVTGKVRQDRANAKLTALTAPDGAVVLVTAQVELAHTVDAGDADVALVRTGELVLVDDGGSWKVDAFDIRTSRDTL